MKMILRIRAGRPVRSGVKLIDGKCFNFSEGWVMDNTDPYPNEIAMIPNDNRWPQSAPKWIASGDLVKAEFPMRRTKQFGKVGE